MGLSFGDFNSDGHIDIFGTNFGDYGLSLCPSRNIKPPPNGSWANRTARSLIPALAISRPIPLAGARPPWITTTAVRRISRTSATSTLVPPSLRTNYPGVVLSNDGSGHFSYDARPFAGETNYNRTEVIGEAVGDLSQQRFPGHRDCLRHEHPDSVPLLRDPISLPPNAPGSPFDSTAYFVPQFRPPAPAPGPGTATSFPTAPSRCR